MGLGTALAIGGIIKGVTSVIGAKKASKASKEAARLQSESADKAMAVQDRVYGEQKALQEPYLAMGRLGAGTLGRLMTPGQPYTPALQAQDARAPRFQGQPSEPTPTQPVGASEPAGGGMRRGTMGALGLGFGGGNMSDEAVLAARDRIAAIPEGGWGGKLLRNRLAQAEARQPAAPGPQPGTMGNLAPPQPGPSGGEMVRLMSPDGAVGNVPRHLAAQFIARGARPA